MPINSRKRFTFILPLSRKSRDGRFIHAGDLEIVGIREEDGQTVEEINYRGVNLIPILDWMENQDQTPSSIYAMVNDAIDNHLSTADPIHEDFTMSMQ